MILSCHSIAKSFDEQYVLRNCSFHIEDNDKAAIVGINGAGKSTLLKIIMGELTADDGQVVLAKDRTIGYLPQYQIMDSDNTIYEELLSVKQDMIDAEHQLRSIELQMKSAEGEHLEKLMDTYTRLMHYFESGNGYAYKSEVIGILKGLGFEDYEFKKEIYTLSGGQKTRVALGKILLQCPDIILLDEPTNHLDMASISWLETYLLNYKGAVVIVSHDRYFLDRITNKIIEIDNSNVTTFSGNYSAYAEKKEILRVAAWNSYMNQQAEIKHQEEVIKKLKSFNREKSIKRAESREKMLDKIEVIDKPVETASNMHMRIEPKKISGNDVLTIEDLQKAFDSQLLFNHLNFQIKRGEHVAIIGNNGTGKTTILKIINALIPADKGKIELGANVSIGYYDQEHHVLHMEKSLFEEIADDYPTLTNTEIRNTLAAFLFTGDDVFKQISSLSGGERGRVSLAKLMLSEANFLILDEPTNHLDIMSKEILEDAINNYTGTVLYVSHDRYFINRTATRILDLSNHTLTNYIGNYDYYLEKSTESQNISNLVNSVSDSSFSTDVSESKLDWKQQKELQAQQRKKENELKKVEDRIAELEERDLAIDTEMSKPEIATNVAELQKLTKEKATISEELTTLYEQWETLSE
ncbi:MAG: ABC-F family ATP-binding cassette domain-containing protein [Lachnospiraceae bacterium]|nr:ABC-F family ATP-binding cassette domain-containing protein [Lachnospiraceae bacterium]